jgi:hypothetical protein
VFAAGVDEAVVELAAAPEACRSDASFENEACRSLGALPALTCEMSDDRAEAKVDRGSPPPAAPDVLDEDALFTASKSECMNCLMSCCTALGAEVELESLLASLDDDAVALVALGPGSDRPRLCSAWATAWCTWPPPCARCGRLAPSPSASPPPAACCGCSPGSAAKAEMELEVPEMFMINPWMSEGVYETSAGDSMN